MTILKIANGFRVCYSDDGKVCYGIPCDICGKMVWTDIKNIKTHFCEGGNGIMRITGMLPFTVPCEVKAVDRCEED